MEKTKTVFSSPSLQQSPAERVLDLLFVSRLSSLTVGAFTYLRTILTERSFMSHCQAATHEVGGLETYNRVVQAALAWRCQAIASEMQRNACSWRCDCAESARRVCARSYRPSCADAAG